MDYILAVLFVAYAVSVLALGWHLVRSIGLVRGQSVGCASHAPVCASNEKGASETRPAGLPGLDVVVPVKDEAEHIGTCLETLLAQDYPDLGIIVVNDRSTDRTAEVVQEIQDRHPQVRRVDIAELPDGLYGKPHALHSVASELKRQCVAFVDSDSRLEPPCLRTLVNHLIANDLDWVAGAGTPEVVGFWERLLVPLMGAVTFAWYDPRKIGDPNWPNAIGSGLMVCRRSSYEVIGGHGAVISAYDEDSELIRIAKRAGQKVAYVLAPELYAQRYYGSLRKTLAGMTRTFVGGLKTVWRTVLTLHGLNFVTQLPLNLLILLTMATIAQWPVPWMPWWWTLTGLHAGISIALAGLVYRTAGVPRAFALLHPLGGAVLMYVCVRAIVHMRGRQAITWRGTRY